LLGIDYWQTITLVLTICPSRYVVVISNDCFSLLLSQQLHDVRLEKDVLIYIFCNLHLTIVSIISLLVSNKNHIDARYKLFYRLMMNENETLLLFRVPYHNINDNQTATLFYVWILMVFRKTLLFSLSE